MQGFENWVEKLPANVGRVVIRIGGRGTLNQSAVIAIVDSGYDESSDAWAATWTPRTELADTLMSAIENAGHPDEYPRVRLDPYTCDGKRLPSKQWTAKATQATNTAPGMESALQALAGGMVAMSGELRRANADLCRVLSQERDYSTRKTLEADQAFEEMRDNETLLTAMELLEEESDTSNDPLRQSASDLLSTIGPALAKLFGGGDDADGDSIREWVKANMSDLVNDPEMQTAFYEAYMNKDKGQKTDDDSPPEDAKHP